MTLNIWVPCAGATNPFLGRLRAINVSADNLLQDVARIGWNVDSCVTVNGCTEVRIRCPRCARACKAMSNEGVTAKTVKLLADVIMQDPSGTRYSLQYLGACSKDALAWAVEQYAKADRFYEAWLKETERRRKDGE